MNKKILFILLLLGLAEVTIGKAIFSGYLCVDIYFDEDDCRYRCRSRGYKKGICQFEITLEGIVGLCICDDENYILRVYRSRYKLLKLQPYHSINGYALQRR